MAWLPEPVRPDLSATAPASPRSSREIPREDWSDFFGRLARAAHGASASLEVVPAVHGTSESQRLQTIVYDHARDSLYMRVTAGRGIGSRHFFIPGPRRVVLEHTPGGIDLAVCDASGMTSIVRLRGLRDGDVSLS
jgi:hypothetical protein